ncbi:hypothetical protein [Acinetobacter beijerinckii]|uniref:hypothetical protein n=1 Tax=Acinetobacter beijerinckii TaxID=262668 RepID=UPI00300AD9C1
MIEVTVQEAHEDYPIKKIIFNDLDIGMERSIWVSSKITCLDKDNNFIYEEITIINRLNRVGTIEIYAGENYKLVAYQELPNDRTKNISRVDNYILMDDKFILMGVDVIEFNEDLLGSRTNHFDKNGNLYYYKISNYELHHSQEYDKDGKELGFWNLHFMECEDIYRTAHSVTRELEQLVIEKYRIND